MVQIVGIESGTPETGEVHTIDVWYSNRRGAWVVERIDAQGGHIGLNYTCATRVEAEACVAEWLRAHTETCLVDAAPAVRRRRLPRAA